MARRTTFLCNFLLIIFMQLMLSQALSKRNILVLSDIHLDPHQRNICFFGSCMDYGRYGLPSPPALFDEVLNQTIFQVYGKHVSIEDVGADDLVPNRKLDAIIITGDFVKPDFYKSEALSGDTEQKLLAFKEVVSNLTK